MGNEDMTADALRQAQPLTTDAQTFAAAQEPPRSSVDEATMAITVSDLFDDDE